MKPPDQQHLLVSQAWSTSYCLDRSQQVEKDADKKEDQLEMAGLRLVGVRTARP